VTEDAAVDVWLYACDRGHFHVAASAGGPPADAVVDDPILLRLFKEICRDELGRFAPCGGGGAASAPSPDVTAATPTPADRVKAFLSGYHAGEDARQTLLAEAAHVEKEKSLGADLQGRANKMLDEFRALGGDEAKEAAWREKNGDAYRTLMGQSIAANTAARERGAGLVAKALAQPDPAPVTGGADALKTDAQKQALAGGLEWLKGKVSRDVLGDLKVQAAPVPAGEKRDFHLRGRIFLTPGTNASVVVHEIGHQLNEAPHVKELANAFWEHRFGGEAATPMRDVCKRCGYDKDEEGHKDDLGKVFGEGKDAHRAYYAGKRYESGQTELVSMGLEQLHRDPVKLAKADPEYFNFLHAVLSGKKLP
jgi:hypothetical protein